MEAYAFEMDLDHLANNEAFDVTAYIKKKTVRERNEDGDMVDVEVVECDEKKKPLKKLYTVTTDLVILTYSAGHNALLVRGDKIEILGSGSTGHGTSFNILRAKYKQGSIAYRDCKRFAHVQSIQAGSL